MHRLKAMRFALALFSVFWISAPFSRAQQPLASATVTPPVSVVQLSSLRPNQPTPLPTPEETPKPYVQSTVVHVKPEALQEATSLLGGRWESRAVIQTRTNEATWGKREDSVEEGAGVSVPERFGSTLRRTDRSGAFTEASVEIKPGESFETSLLQGVRLLSTPSLTLDAALGGTFQPEEKEKLFASQILASYQVADPLRLGLGLRSEGERCSAYAGLELRLGEKYFVGVDCMVNFRQSQPSSSDSMLKIDDTLFGNAPEGVTFQLNLGSIAF